MPTRLCILLLLWLAGTGEAAAQYVDPAEKPYVGDPVTVTLPAADTLLVTYRPNSSIARRVLIPAEGRQTVVWTPAEAGVVALATPQGGPQQNVSVRFDTPPVSGIFILLLAGAILFGGAVFAFVKLFQEDPPESEPPVRPDT